MGSSKLNLILWPLLRKMKVALLGLQTFLIFDILRLVKKSGQKPAFVYESGQRKNAKTAEKVPFWAVFRGFEGVLRGSGQKPTFSLLFTIKK